MEKEKFIKISPEPVTYEGTQAILNQMNKCVCKIYSKGEGTGFFTKIPFNSELLPVLITNNHVLSKNEIKNNNIIMLSLNSDKNKKAIKINEDRKTYTNKELDITIIEIKEKEDKLNNEYIELDDDIINFFKDKKNEYMQYLQKIYSNKSIYILHYPKGNNIVVSYGQPPEFNNTEIRHKCSTEHGSSGSPIILIDNQKLIGIHCAGHPHPNFKYNIGTIIIDAIIDFQKKSNNKINNYIIAEFETEEDNQTIRIINSFEDSRRDHTWMNDKKEYYNEKEIKEKCEIIINGKVIPFSYKYKFNKKGKYTIKYIFKNNMTNTNCIFGDCKSLVNINLSNFNTQKVTSMGFMFDGCSVDVNY